MPIIGVNLREIHLEREESDVPVNIKRIKNDVSIKGIKERDIGLGQGKKALIFDFQFTSDYLLEKDNRFGQIKLSGEVISAEENSVIKKTLDEWKKKKKIDEKVFLPVIQAAFDLCEVEAICLSRKITLPSPIELPKIKPTSSQQGYIG